MIVKKMNSVFGYIKEHLDGNEQTIAELSKKNISKAAENFSILQTRMFKLNKILVKWLEM